MNPVKDFFFYFVAQHSECVNERECALMVKIESYVLSKNDFIRKLKNKIMKHEFPFILM